MTSFGRGRLSSYRHARASYGDGWQIGRRRGRLRGLSTLSSTHVARPSVRSSPNACPASRACRRPRCRTGSPRGLARRRRRRSPSRPPSRPPRLRATTSTGRCSTWSGLCSLRCRAPPRGWRCSSGLTPPPAVQAAGYRTAAFLDVEDRPPEGAAIAAALGELVHSRSPYAYLFRPLHGCDACPTSLGAPAVAMRTSAVSLAIFPLHSGRR